MTSYRHGNEAVQYIQWRPHSSLITKHWQGIGQSKLISRHCSPTCFDWCFTVFVGVYRILVCLSLGESTICSPLACRQITKHKIWITVGLMLGQCRRRWANIKPTLVQSCACRQITASLFGLNDQVNTALSLPVQWLPSVADDGPTLKQNKLNVLCLQGKHIRNNRPSPYNGVVW